jgi:hypothetical protein
MRTAARRATAHPAETVVALATLNADPQRVRVMVRASGRSRARCACAMPREQAEALRIRVGSRWSASVAARVEASHAAALAREAALRMLAAAPRALSVTTLARRLHARGLPPGAVATAIRQLRSDGWISDRIRGS